MTYWMSDFEAELSIVLRRFLKKYVSKNNKLYILLILEISALKWCNMYLTDIWFKRVMRDQNKYFDSNYRHFRDWKILSCHDLGYQMSIFKKKTLYQIKVFNIFFIMEFTSWKYLIPFKSYTHKVLKNTCPGFSKNVWYFSLVINRLSCFYLQGNLRFRYFTS
jgi:hypothetical protein